MRGAKHNKELLSTLLLEVCHLFPQHCGAHSIPYSKDMHKRARAYPTTDHGRLNDVWYPPAQNVVEEAVMNLSHVIQYPTDLSVVVGQEPYSALEAFMDGLTVCGRPRTARMAGSIVTLRIIAESSAIEVKGAPNSWFTELVSCKLVPRTRADPDQHIAVYPYRDHADGNFSLVVDLPAFVLTFKSTVTPWSELCSIEERLAVARSNRDAVSIQHVFPKHPEHDVAAGITRIVAWSEEGAATVRWLVLHTYPTRMPGRKLPACVITESALELK